MCLQPKVDMSYREILWIFAEKLQKQSEENRDALIGEFDGFSFASWRANAVYRTLEDMCDEGLLTEKEYRECKI